MRQTGLAVVGFYFFFQTVSEVRAQFVCQPGRPLFTLYLVPNSNGAVVVLLDEDVAPIFPVLNNAAAGEPGTVAREERDVFAGVEAIRVTPLQKYQPTVPGWNFKVVERPENANEFRFVRFAWKKLGGSGVMVQLHDSDKQGWGLRYHAGQNTPGWGSKSVADKTPVRWEVVTRDLFQDFQNATITGISLAPLDGEAGLFDHIMLGRSVADLDRTTDEALGKLRPAVPLEGKRREALWQDLIGTDRVKAAASLRVFLAFAPEQIDFIRGQLPRDTPESKALALRLIEDLDSAVFAIREAATDELVALGPAALPAIRIALESSSAEVRLRARKINVRIGDAAQDGAAAARVVRVIERSGTVEGKRLLKELADGMSGSDFSLVAKRVIDSRKDR